MAYSIERNPVFTLVDLQSDRLDSNLAPTLKAEFLMLNAEGVKNIIVNLGRTRFCDSSGLSSILIANRLCKNASGKLVLCNLQENVQKLITLSRLENVLAVSSGLEEAKLLLN
jgi:anti-sigma B factor antagonist